MKKLKITGYVASELDIQKEEILFEEERVLEFWDGKILTVTRENVVDLEEYVLNMGNQFDYQIEAERSGSELLRDYKLLRSGFYRLHDRLMKVRRELC